MRKACALSYETLDLMERKEREGSEQYPITEPTVCKTFIQVLQKTLALT